MNQEIDRPFGHVRGEGGRGAANWIENVDPVIQEVREEILADVT